MPACTFPQAAKACSRQYCGCDDLGDLLAQKKAVPAVLGGILEFLETELSRSEVAARRRYRDRCGLVYAKMIVDEFLSKERTKRGPVPMHAEGRLREWLVGGVRSRIWPIAYLPPGHGDRLLFRAARCLRLPKGSSLFRKGRKKTRERYEAWRTCLSCRKGGT